MMQTVQSPHGFTLIELMVTVAILLILLMVAIPAYQRYVDTAQEAVLVSNINSLQVFQEDFFLHNGNYAVGLTTIADIKAAIGWEPQQQDGILYAIVDGPSGDASDYDVTATHPDGLIICVTFPDKIRC